MQEAPTRLVPPVFNVTHLLVEEKIIKKVAPKAAGKAKAGGKAKAKK